MAGAVYSCEALNPEDYYAGFLRDRVSGGSLGTRFKDIDNKTHFENYMQLLKDPQTHNFVLDFGNEDAYCAANITTDEFKLLLSNPVCERFPAC